MDFSVSQQLDSPFVTAWERRGTYILKYVISEPSSAADLVSSPGYPDQFRMRARVVLDRRKFDIALMAQYENGYHDYSDQPPAEKKLKDVTDPGLQDSAMGRPAIYRKTATRSQRTSESAKAASSNSPDFLQECRPRM